MAGFYDAQGMWHEVADQFISPEVMAGMQPTPVVPPMPLAPSPTPTAVPPQGPAPVIPTPVPPDPGPPLTQSPTPGIQQNLGVTPGIPVTAPTKPLAPAVSPAKKALPTDFNVGRPEIAAAEKPRPLDDFGYAKALETQKTAAGESAAITSAEQMGMSDLYGEAAQASVDAAESAKRVREAYNEPFVKTEQAISESLATQAKEIDPKKYWKSKGSWEKVGAALAIMGGAIGDALMQIGGVKGPGNQALNIIMSAVQDDIEAQKADRATAANKTSQLYNQYQMYRTKLGDDLAAEHATYVDKLEGIKNRALALGAAASSKQAQANFANTVGLLDKEIANHNFELHKFNTQAAIEAAKLADKAKLNPQIGQMYQAEQSIERLYQAGTKKPDFAFTSSDEQMLEGAMDQWAMSYLKANGGRFTPEAIKSVKKAFFPTKWTFSEAVEGFRARRQNAMKTLVNSTPSTEPEAEAGF